MIPQAVRTAEKAFRKYRTRDPYEIVESRNIKLKYFEQPENLLGFYTVMNRRQIIGLNAAADELMKRTGLIHEIGHSLNDYRAAASGGHFADCRFFSFSVLPAEAGANLAGAHLCVPDGYILDRIYYSDYLETVGQIRARCGAGRAFEEERMREFYDMHSGFPTVSELAADLGVDAGVVKYKLKALSYKGYELPGIPEIRSDFLKDWKRTPEE